MKRGKDPGKDCLSTAFTKDTWKEVVATRWRYMGLMTSKIFTKCLKDRGYQKAGKMQP